MRHRFIRFWSSLLTLLGWLAIAAGVGAGVVITLLQLGSKLAGRPLWMGVLVGLAGAVVGFVAGALVGAPLVAMGQGLDLLQRQHARLLRIDRRLRAAERRLRASAPPASAAATSSSAEAVGGAHSLADRLRVRR